MAERKNLFVQMKPDEHAAIKEAAARARTSVAAMVKEALAKHLAGGLKKAS